MAGSPKDLPYRFTVTDNEVVEETKKINESIKQMDGYLQKLGGDYDKLTVASRKTYNEQIKAMRHWDDAATAAAKLQKIQWELNKAVAAGALTQTQATEIINAKTDAMARELALAQRLRDTQTGGGARGTSRAAVVSGGLPPPPTGFFEDMTKGSKSAIDAINKLSFSIFALTFGTQQLGELFLRTFVQVGEQVERQRKRMELLTGSTETYAKVLQAANDVGVSMDTFSQGFTRFAIANEQIGLTNDELVQMTKTITQLGIIGGGTAQEVSAGMQQLSQGFAAGRLAGDEFRSVMENLPYLAVQMAKEMKVSVGALREMSTAGELVPQKMADAFLAMSERVNKVFEDMPVTSEMGLARIETAWSQLINVMLKAGGIDTVGQAFSDWAEGLADLASAFEQNQVQIMEWAPAVQAVAEAVAVMVVGWYAVARPLGQAYVAMRNLVTLMGAAKTAATALATANAALAAGTGSLAAAQEAQAVATAASAAATKAWLAVTVPAVAILGTIAYAWYSLADAQEKATKAGEEAVKQVKAAGPELATWSRRTLEATAAQIQRNIVLKEAALAEKQAQEAKGLERLQIFTDPDTRAYYENAWGLSALSIEVAKLKGELTDEKAVLGEVNAATNSNTEASRSAAIAMAGMSKEAKDLAKELDKVKKSSEDMANRINRIREMGLVEGEAQADRDAIKNEYIAQAKAESERYNALQNVSAAEATAHEANLRRFQDVYEYRMRDLEIQRVHTEQTKKETGAVKELSDAEKARLRDLNADISKLESLVNQGNPALLTAREDLEKLLTASSGEITPEVQKLYDSLTNLDAKLQEADTRLKALRTERDALEGSGSKTARAEDNAEWKAELDAIKRAADAAAESVKKMKEVEAFKRDTAAMNRGALTGDARVLADAEAEKDAVRAEWAEKQLTDAQALADRLVAIDAEASRQIRDNRQKDIDALAGTIYQSLSSSFTALADSGDSLNDVLGRMVKSLRDMIVQITILKPLSEFLAGAINGAMGGDAKSNAASEAGSALGAIIKNIKWTGANGGAINAALPYGVYSSPTLFPMASPGHRAFAMGTGLIGEAGPEAVLPLSRGPDGKLGVQGGASPINVVVNTRPGDTAKVSQDGGVLTIDIIEQAMASRLSRGGSALPQAMETSYAGIRRQGR